MNLRLISPFGSITENNTVGDKRCLFVDGVEVRRSQVSGAGETETPLPEFGRGEPQIEPRRTRSTKSIASPPVWSGWRGQSFARGGGE